MGAGDAEMRWLTSQLRRQLLTHPILLFTVPVVVTGLLTALVVDWRISSGMHDQLLRTTELNTVAMVQASLEGRLHPQQSPNGPSIALDGAEELLWRWVKPDLFVHMRLYDPRGRIVWSNDRSLIGQVQTSEEVPVALTGRATVKEHAPGEAGHIDPVGGLPGKFLEAYIPIRNGAQVVAVVEGYLALDPLLAGTAAVHQSTRLALFFGTGLSILVLAGLGVLVSRLVTEQMQQLERAARAASEARRATIRALAAAIDARDPYTHGHSSRVAHYATNIARRLGWTPDAVERLEEGALLHDVGKIAVPDVILRKQGTLEPEEFELMKQHPTVGGDLVQGIHGMADLTPMVRLHHERMDGRGYPLGLSGDQIPLAARIIAVADTYDAVTTDRPYRAGRKPREALVILQEAAGVQLDPELVSLVTADPTLLT